MILHTSSGRRVVLGPELNRGGEGIIYLIQDHPDLLAKIYLHPHAGQVNKIAWMCRNIPQDPTRGHGHASLAWPMDSLMDEKGCFVGYVMPYIRDAYPILEVFNPLRRNLVFPEFNWKYMHRVARNLAAAVGALHARGYVVGDLNESNILVTSTAMVTLIDTDSFQVQEPRADRIMVYPCPVGKPEYTPPELQGNAFWGAMRRPEHDGFALGVLIFQLLMNGSHPFRSRWLGSGEPPPIEEKIRRGYYPYVTGLRPVCVPPPNTPSIQNLYPPLAKLWARCFVDGTKDGHLRPTPREWEQILVEAEASLVQCNNHHFYCGLLRTGRILWCPECRDSYRPDRLIGYAISSFLRRAALSADSPTVVYRKKRRRMIANAWRKYAFTVLAVLLLGISVGASFLGDAERLEPAEKPVVSKPQPAPVTEMAPARPQRKTSVEIAPVADPLFADVKKAPLITVVGIEPSVQLGGAGVIKGDEAKKPGETENPVKPEGIPNTNVKIQRRIAKVIKTPKKRISQENIRELAVRTTLSGHPAGLSCLSYSPKGKLLVSGSEGADLKIWQTTDWSLTNWKEAAAGATCLAFSPDGDLMATGSREKTVNIWQTRNGENLLVLSGHKEPITSLSFSPDGSLMASGSADNTIRIWRCKDGELLYILKGHRGDITSLDFSPNGEVLVSASKDNTLRIWRVQDGSVINKIKAHSRAVTSVAFSSDGGWLATGSSDRTVKLWHAGQLINTIKGHVKAVTCLTFSPDGKLLATGSDDQTVRIWNTQDGKPLATLGGSSTAIKGIAFSPDGSSIAVGCNDGTMQVWETGR